MLSSSLREAVIYNMYWSLPTPFIMCLVDADIANTTSYAHYGAEIV